MCRRSHNPRHGAPKQRRSLERGGMVLQGCREEDLHWDMVKVSLLWTWCWRCCGSPDSDLAGRLHNTARRSLAGAGFDIDDSASLRISGYIPLVPTPNWRTHRARRTSAHCRSGTVVVCRAPSRWRVERASGLMILGNDWHRRTLGACGHQQREALVPPTGAIEGALEALGRASRAHALSPIFTGPC